MMHEYIAIFRDLEDSIEVRRLPLGEKFKQAREGLNTHKLFFWPFFNESRKEIEVILYS